MILLYLVVIDDDDVDDKYDAYVMMTFFVILMWMWMHLMAEVVLF